MTATLAPLADRIVVPADADRPDWLRARTGNIGGSDVAPILGLSKWCSPFERWLHLTGQVPPEDQEPSEAARWGNLLEPIVAAEFSERTGIAVARPWKRQGPVYAHPEHRQLRCTPDGFLGSFEAPDGLYSGKTTTAWLAHEWDPESKELPAASLVQLMHEFYVTGLDGAWVAALVGGQRLVTIEVERDDQAVEDLIALELDWHQRHVAEMRPPDPVGTDAEMRFLSDLFPASMGEVEVLDWSEFRRWGNQKLTAEADAADAKQRKTQAEDAIRLMLGEATEGVVDDELVVTWREQQGKTTPDVGELNHGINRIAMAAQVLLDTEGAGSAEEHSNAGLVLLEALADCRAAMTKRSDPVRVLRMTKAGRARLGG
jgi:putative phage-type endonuclease